MLVSPSDGTEVVGGAHDENQPQHLDVECPSTKSSGLSASQRAAGLPFFTLYRVVSSGNGKLRNQVLDMLESIFFRTRGMK